MPRVILKKNQIDEAHDWVGGQTWSNGGTDLHSTDECCVCLLQRRWKRDRQHGIDAHYTFSDESGELSLRRVLARGCA